MGALIAVFSGTNEWQGAANCRWLDFGTEVFSIYTSAVVVLKPGNHPETAMTTWRRYPWEYSHSRSLPSVSTAATSKQGKPMASRTAPCREIPTPVQEPWAHRKRVMGLSVFTATSRRTRRPSTKETPGCWEHRKPVRPFLGFPTAKPACWARASVALGFRERATRDLESRGRATKAVGFPDGATRLACWARAKWRWGFRT